MNVRITRSIMVAAIAALVLVAGSTVAWAQCPTSPTYSPDFSNVPNQSCLTLNSNGSYAGYPGFYPAVPPPPPNVTTVLRLTPNAGGQASSVWYNTQQNVASAFSTTFTFQLSGTSTYNADGIAFVIQNSALTALGPAGCGVGFGGSSSGCTPAYGTQVGIPNSLAVVFKTYQDYGDPNSNYVAIQSCLTGANSVDPSCTIPNGVNSSLPITLADGSVHTVVINYSGPSNTLLDVILDGTDLFPPSEANPSGGVLFNMASIGLASSGSCSNCLAYVGFTGAGGGGNDNEDIQSWSFTPGAQSAALTVGVTSTLSFPNAQGNNVYSYTAELTAPYPSPVVSVDPMLVAPATCDALVQKNFGWPTRCFVYDNAEGTGVSSAVMFAVTCSNGPCGSNVNPFDANLGTIFSFLPSQNPFFFYPGFAGPINPLPGWLKYTGPYADPCTPPANDVVAMTNQVSLFSVDSHVVGSSGGGASCWFATYDTVGENPPGITITSPTPFATYKQGSAVPATYTCSNPNTSQPLSSATGPYLTAESCTQNSGTQASCTFTPIVGPGNLGGLSCTGGTVDTSKKGLHFFVVTALDTGQNQNFDIVPYTVK